jgi:hypothetical protein
MLDSNQGNDRVLDQAFEEARRTSVPEGVEHRLQELIRDFPKRISQERVKTTFTLLPSLFRSRGLAIAAVILVIVSVGVLWVKQGGNEESVDVAIQPAPVRPLEDLSPSKPNRGLTQLLLVSRYSQTPSLAQTLVNGSLDEASDAPVGWKFLSASSGFSLEIVSDTNSEKHARIVGKGPLTAEDFGNLFQSLDASAFRNRRIQFTGRVRTSDLAAEASTHLWLRIDAEGRDRNMVPIVFDNMSKRPITSSNWDEYQIVCDVPENARFIHVGAFLINVGSAEVDDFQLRIVDESVPETAAKLNSSIEETDSTPPSQSDSTETEEPKGKVGLIKNAGFEASSEINPAREWLFNPANTKASLATGNDAAEGDRCLHLVSEPFRWVAMPASISQSIQASSLGGKVVRFRGAARIEPRDGGRIQFVLEANRPSGNGVVRAIVDHMHDRPITSDQWRYYDIVVRLPLNVTTLRIGADFYGGGEAWIDDFQLEVVDDESSVSLTALARDVEKPSEESTRWIAFGLTLALLSLALFLWSHRPATNFGQPFALRFSVVYWLLYCDSTILQVISQVSFLSPYTLLYSRGLNWLVRYTGHQILGIQREMIPPAGSGDTTHSYVQLLVMVTLAFFVATIWRLCSRVRKWDHIIYDIYLCFLRYSLASILVGYGVAKVVFQMNQFPSPGPESLQTAIGDMTPMALIWLMMGSSKAYTFIAGAGELLAGLLLLWRRTTILGAGIGLGVMLNVAFLNLCYEIPVKQYSLHLVGLCVLLLASDIRWLKVILGNRSVERRELGPRLPNRYWKAGYYFAKLVLIYLVFWPYLGRVIQDWRTPAPPKNPLIGFFEAESHNSQTSQDASAQTKAWSRFTIRPRRGVGQLRMYDIVIKDAAGNTMMRQVFLPDDSAFVVGEDRLECKWLDSYRVRIEGEFEGEELSFVATRKGTILTSRGFHWINEVPYN